MAMTDNIETTAQHDPNQWKMPPFSKFFEALTAVADKRVRESSATAAEVVSSDGGKTYTVQWSVDGKAIVSNDNASYWQGCMGYPILAVLMQTGRVKFDPAVAALLSGVEWAKINKQFKRNYDKAVESVLTGLEKKGLNRKTVLDEVDRLVDQTLHLRLHRLRGTIPPPREA